MHLFFVGVSRPSAAAAPSHGFNVSPRFRSAVTLLDDLSRTPLVCAHRGLEAPPLGFNVQRDASRKEPLTGHVNSDMKWPTHNVASRFGAQTTRQIVVALTSVAAFTASAATSGSREHQIKAAALYNIIAFTEWPATAFASADSPMVVGVLGNGPIAKLLEEFLANENWQGRRVALRWLSNPAEARFCHVLYVERSEQSRWPAMARGFARLPVLTVSDTDHFARDGGVIQLAIERNKLRLVVNLGVARACGLTISSKVLRLANVIDNRAP